MAALSALRSLYLEYKITEMINNQVPNCIDPSPQSSDKLYFFEKNCEIKTADYARIIIYGAVSHAPNKKPQAYDKIKRLIHLTIDRIAARTGFIRRINYKNYERHWTYNRGDLAIADSVHSSLEKKGSTIPIIRCNWGELPELNLSAQDIIIVAGSGYIHPNKSGNLPKRIFSDYETIKRSGSRVALIGIGVNVLLDWDRNKATNLTDASRQLLDDLFQLCSSITVRDEQSHNFIQMLGNHRPFIIGDPALFLPVQPKESKNREPNSQIRIGLSIPFHGIEPTEWIQKNIKEFIAFLKIIQKTKRANFYYFLHYDSERLVYKIMRDSGINVTLIDGDTLALLQSYRNLDLHIGGMLHSCIMASSQRIPTIALAYDAKHFGFFKLIEKEDFCVHYQSIDYKKITKLIDQIIDNRDNQKEKLDIRIKHLELNYLDALSKAVSPIQPSEIAPQKH